ncbi:methionine aminopeptidase, type I [Deinococcus geothermalis DSM 11300]|uniref:Methionine aminopeptidase n=1 Tax=Deinococcus geothermalis (strain DSM 11300 / CIP 105573 / AG-3a) TaxID=319795 RepID=Q1IX25_DEIGD|nr:MULTISPECIES: type I methionyl aminopeptidase [Deinococcus]ABF46209.1 methionine aminopeptidase, type I [Deinococcus geothermalis DSM 11300]MBI0444671.1 type I methionyl aminopeptidase [Deinococcus sp. DB0503]
MTIGNARDLEGMKRAGQVVARTLEALKAAVEPGITPAELDRLAGQVFAQYGAFSAPRAEYGAPVHVFISVNDDIVHGLPTARPLAAGDVVSIDVTPNVGGYIADAAVTVAVPPASPVATRLIACAEAAFSAALNVARAGRPLNGIGRAIETEVARRGLTLLRELQGHGVGRAIHEKPDVPSFYHPALKKPLHEGLVIAVEPMVSTGRAWRTKTLRDGWTIATTDGGIAAHFEHTIMVTKGAPLILTA